MDFSVHKDHNGSLISFEKDVNTPFAVHRVYYIYGTPNNTLRGKHAHKNTEQIIICLSGSCDFILDDGEKRETVRLDNPETGLYLNSCVWREFTNFSVDCILLVVASSLYDKNDYIRDYDEFLRMIGR